MTYSKEKWLKIFWYSQSFSRKDLIRLKVRDDEDQLGQSVFSTPFDPRLTHASSPHLMSSSPHLTSS
jgi:hypothetical protein